MNKVRGGRVRGDGVLTHERWGVLTPPDPPVDPPLFSQPLYMRIIGSVLDCSDPRNKQ